MRMRLILYAMILLSLFISYETLYAEEIRADAIHELIAEREGIQAENLEVSYHEYFPLSLTGGGYYFSKAIDRVTGRSYGIAADQDGNIVDHEALLADEKAAYRAKYGKLHPSLYHALETKGLSDRVRVSIWLDMGGRSAEIERPTREESRTLGREEIKSRHQEGLNRASSIHADVQRPIIEFLNGMGFEIRGSEIAPLVTAELPRAVIEQLTQIPYVDTIDILVEGGPEGERENVLSGGPEAYTARRTEKADCIPHNPHDMVFASGGQRYQSSDWTLLSSHTHGGRGLGQR